MSAVYEAHLRMLATLPVRTHEQKPVGFEKGPHRHRIRELVKKGVVKRRIHSLLGISRPAVQKHLRAIKRGK